MRPNEVQSIYKTSKEKWGKLIRQLKGSHEMYEKDGVIVILPNHGSKELPYGLEKDLRKKMGL